MNEAESVIVRELFEINIDSFNALTRTAERLQEVPVESVLATIAAQRLAQAAELRSLLHEMTAVANPIRPIRYTRLVERAIFDWARLGGARPVKLLESAERSERYVKAKYEAALPLATSQRVRAVIDRQYSAVRESLAETQLNCKRCQRE